MFSIGDKIVHPMHGAGIIESIVAEKIDGTYHDYYVFKMPMNGLVLKIPTNNADAIGIRPIDSPEQIEAVFCMLPQLSSDMSNNWNRRYRENLAHLKSGDLLEVASVIKGLMPPRQPARPLHGRAENAVHRQADPHFRGQPGRRHGLWRCRTADQRRCEGIGIRKG